MSNSKRWADGSEAADEVVPVDGFFADGNTVRGRNTSAPNESSKGDPQKGQQDSAVDLAQAFWGAPEAFSVDARNAHSAPPVWSMAPDSQFGGKGSGAEAAPGAMDAQQIDPFFGAHGGFHARPEQGVDETAPGEDGRIRSSEAGRNDGATPFDPFMGAPFGAPLGVPGGSGFFPGVPSVDLPEGAEVQLQPGVTEAPEVAEPAFHGLGQAGPSLWGPSFSDDPSPETSLGAPEATEFGYQRGDDGLPPPPSHEEMGAEILPWPGRSDSTSIDAPIPVMSVSSASDFLGDAVERAPAPAFDSTGAPDLLAEAVESALRNVYGDDLGDDLAPEQGSYMAERGLLRETSSGAQEPTPAMTSLRDIYGEDSQGPSQRAADENESAEDWFGGRLEHQPATFVAEPTTEAATEAVLHYLYGRREGGDPTDGYSPTPPPYDGESAPYDERSQGRHAGPSFTGRRAGDPTSFEEPYPGGRTEPAFRSHSEAGDPRWDQSQQRSLSATSRSLARIEPDAATHAPGADAAEDFADKDSGRLLGVAGLSLIGGIAVGGIVAAIAFNFFVSDNAGDPMLDPMAFNPTASVKQDTAFNTPVAPQTFEPSGGVAAGPEGASRSSRAAIADTAPARGRADSRAGGPVGAEERLPLIPANTPTPVKLQMKPAGPISVADASGAAPGPIPISLSIASSAPTEAALVSIKGLPDQAKLSGGIDVGGGRWLLPPQKVDGLALTVPTGVSGDFKLEAQLMASDVRTAVSEPTPFTVSITGDGDALAAVAPPAYQPPSPREERALGGRSESQENRDLLQDGNKLMREGDIIGARRFYEKVAASGSAEGAQAMGRSYDPSYYENLPVKTGKPDPAQAFEWYKKALDGGLDTARVKIDNLKQWLLR